jgi:pantoate--beta-alanine ligase
MPEALQIVRTPQALTEAMEAWKRAGNRVAFVPTMGALHAGHLALVSVGLANADKVAASIFVNPKQFGPTEDLDKYPRDEAGDAAKLQAAGCSLLYAPDVATMYPPGFASYVRVSGLPDVLCGAARPGHFDGVATVVSKLVTRIIGGAIVRDHDGLALSSRNMYLNPAERQGALALPEALAAARAALLAGRGVAGVLAEARIHMTDAGFARVDYVELVDEEQLFALPAVAPGARLMAAAVMGTTRLIDNLAI